MIGGTLSNRSLLRRVGKPNSPALEAYRADGGYRALAKALNEMTPAQVVDAVKASGLRGRGGAGFPCGMKWTFLPKDHPGPIYLCVNGDESEPGTFNNRILIEEDPHQVLEGIILACYATRASIAYFYLRLRIWHLLSPPCRPPLMRLMPPICWAAIFSAKISISTSTCTAGPGPTFAAKKRV